MCSHRKTRLRAVDRDTAADRTDTTASLQWKGEALTQIRRFQEAMACDLRDALVEHEVRTLVASVSDLKANFSERVAAEVVLDNDGADGFR